MENPAQDNSTSVTEGTAETNAAGTSSLENIMGNMTASNAPEAKPAEGKAEGKENSQNETKAPAWTSQLPEEMRTNSDLMKQLEKFGKIGDLAKSYTELESKLGTSITKPGKEASAEEVDAFYKKIGKPESADGYDMKGEEAAAFRELAYKNNLSVDQAKGIFEALQQIGNGFIAQQQAQVMQSAKATEEALKAEYGNDYTTKLELCKRGVQTYGGPELGAKLQASGLLYDPDVVKMFIRLGEQSAEAGSAGTSAPGKRGYVSNAEGGSFNFKGL